MSKVIQILMSKTNMIVALRDDGTIWQQQQQEPGEDWGNTRRLKWSEVKGPDGPSQGQEDELEAEKNRLRDRMARAGKTVLVQGHDLGELTRHSPAPESFDPERYRK